MAKTVHDDVLDAALNLIKTTADRVILCSAQPTTYAEANATYALADQAVDSSDFTGPANGDTSGRKLTVTAQTGVSVDTTGTSNHVAVVDDGTSKLLYVTTHTGQVLTAGNSANIGAWDIELADPA
jgi:hypothetical protein